jgi:hypothetical protein
VSPRRLVESARIPTFTSYAVIGAFGVGLLVGFSFG